MYEKYLTRSILEAESKIQNTFHCKTVNCPGWCIIEDEINQFDCPVCMKKNCLTCQVYFFIILLLTSLKLIINR